MVQLNTGGGANWSELSAHFTTSGNITSTWTASTQVINVSGTTFTGNNIAGASDTAISSKVASQILITDNDATNTFKNRTPSGDISMSRTGVFSLTSNSVSGNKIANRGVGISKIDTASKNSGDILEVNSNSSVDTVTRFTVVSSVLEFSGSVSGTTVNGKLRITGTDTNTQRSNAEITTIAQSAFADGNGISFTLSNGVQVINATGGGNGGGETLTFSDTTEIDFDKTGTTVSATIKSGSVTLSKLNPGSGNAGKIPKVNSAGDGFEFADDNTGEGGGGGATTLEGLTNVQAGTPTGGDIIVYNSNEWQRAATTGRNGIFSNLKTINSTLTSVHEFVPDGGGDARLINAEGGTNRIITPGEFVVLSGNPYSPSDDNQSYIETDPAASSSQHPMGICVKNIPADTGTSPYATKAVLVSGIGAFPDGIANFTGTPTQRQRLYLKWETINSVTRWYLNNTDGLFVGHFINDGTNNTFWARLDFGLVAASNEFVEQQEFDSVLTEQTFTNYTYVTSLSAVNAVGRLHFQANSDLSSVKVRVFPKAVDLIGLQNVFKLDHRIEVRGTGVNSSKFARGTVGTATNISGGAIEIDFVNGSVEANNASFTDVTLNIKSLGRLPDWNDVEFNRLSETTPEKIASTVWVNEYIADHFGKKTVTGFSALAGGTTPTANKQVVWNSTDSDFEFYLDDTTYNSVKDLLRSGHWLEFYSTSSLETFERCKISSVGTRTNNLISLVVTDQWIKNTAHQGASTNIGIRFVGNRRYEIEQYDRENRQYCQSDFNAGEGSNGGAVNSYNATFSAGAQTSKIGRMGIARTGRYRNNTLLNSGSEQYLGFRALANNSYAVCIVVQGTFYCGNANNSGYGLQFCMQYRTKLSSSTTWGSWNNCDNQDDGSGSNLIYDASNAYKSDAGGNISFVEGSGFNGDARPLSLFKGKESSGSSGGLDAAFPANLLINVGGSVNDALRTQGADRDFEFWIGYSATGNTITAVYELQAHLTATRVS